MVEQVQPKVPYDAKQLRPTTYIKTQTTSIMLIMVMAGGEQDWMQRRLVTLLQHSILLTAPHDLLDGSYDSVKKALQVGS